jgi:hypothetical protein
VTALGHDPLVESLAGHLLAPDRMVWRDMQLGPSGTARPDVFTMFKSYAHPQAMAYECKVSRADFRSDVTSGKWQTYLKFASGVYFAVEAGLIDKREVPEHCGLIVLTGGRWRAQKKPVLNPAWELPRSAWLKMLIDGVSREGANGSRRAAATDWRYTRTLEDRHGEILAKTIRDRLGAEDEIAMAKIQAKRIEDGARQSAERIRKEAQMVEEMIPGLRAQLCEVLELPPEADHYAIQRAVGRIRDSLRQHPLESRYENLTNDVQRALARYGFKRAEDGA